VLGVSGWAEDRVDILRFQGMALMKMLILIYVPEFVVRCRFVKFELASLTGKGEPQRSSLVRFLDQTFSKDSSMGNNDNPILTHFRDLMVIYFGTADAYGGHF